MPKFKIDRQFGPFTWAGLSSLRTLSFLRIGYLGAVVIPIVAYILRTGKGFGVEIQLPLTLFWMYFGSASLALGHLLNEIGCPQLIKRYPSLHEFRAHLADSFLHQAAIHEAARENIEEFVQAELQSGRDQIPPAEHKRFRDVFAELYLRARNTRAEEGNSAPATASVINPENEWENFNRERAILRFFIVGFYAVAALIVAIFSVRQFWIVWQATFP